MTWKLGFYSDWGLKQSDGRRILDLRVLLTTLPPQIQSHTFDNGHPACFCVQKHHDPKPRLGVRCFTDPAIPFW